MKKSRKANVPNFEMNNHVSKMMGNVLNVKPRGLTKKKSHRDIKGLLKRAARENDDPFNTLKHMRKFLSKAIDIYEELQEEEVEGELSAANSKKKGTFDEIFVILGTDIVEFAEDNDVTEVGDYADLQDNDILEENPIDYMKTFHDYLTDVLKDFKASPSEDKFQSLDKLQKIIRSVLRHYVEEEHSSANVPAAVKDELDDLLGSIGAMKL
jgi:hypothetical protein